MLVDMSDGSTEVIAGFLIARGPWWWIGYGWEGCFEVAPPLPPLIQTQVGVPVTNCSQVAPGVFARNYSLGYAELDCNSFTATLSF